MGHGNSLIVQLVMELLPLLLGTVLAMCLGESVLNMGNGRSTLGIKEIMLLESVDGELTSGERGACAIPGDSKVLA